MAEAAIVVGQEATQDLIGGGQVGGAHEAEFTGKAVACPVCNEPLLAVNQQEHMAFTWVSFVQKLLQAEGSRACFLS